MIPYVTLPPLFIGSLLVQPFALLVSIGVLVAHFLIIARARRLGLGRALAAEMSLAMVVCGFAGAIAFKLLYRPDLLATAAASGCEGVLRTLPGISSFGGVLGALAGGWLYLRARGVRASERLRYFDAVSFAFPFGFAFGRLGCSLAHDHPGIHAEAGWLTVAYPDGARFDLGVLELLFLVGVSAAFVWLNRKPRAAGFFAAAMLTSYGLFRVALDRLHVDPPRYAGFSVDQWAGAGVTIIGLFFWRQRLRAAGPL